LQRWPTPSPRGLYERPVRRLLLVYGVIGLSWLSRPQYIYRPSQLVRRLTQRSNAEPVVQTPWGCRMLVARRDLIGAGIARMGVHELAVSEVMWRLAEDDDLAIDVGANIGYFSGLLACRAREVTALEPNPQLRRFITANIGRWEVGQKVRLETRAASDSNGTAVLHLPDHYESNYGIATLEASDGAVSYEVETVRLDDIIGARDVGVLKLDVEGHEMTVLRGAAESLAQGRVRDIIFEHHLPFPSPVSMTLQSAGFTIRGIEQTLTRPVLVPADRAHTGWDAPTYLATRDLERTELLMAPRGWRCLRGR
jgi:FkbM family methyltransferase